MFNNINIDKVALNVFRKPTTERTIRQIAKEVNLSPATAAKCVKALEQKNIIKARKIAKSHLITGNIDSDTYKFYKKIANMISLEELNIRIKQQNPQAVVLYGSYRRGEDMEKSDVDIAIIGEKFDIDLQKIEEKIGRNIHLLFFDSFKEIPPQLKKNLYNGVKLQGVLP